MNSRQTSRATAVPIRAQTPPRMENKLEYFLIGLSPDIIENKLGPPINRILRKYRARKEWKDNRKREVSVSS